MGHRDRTYVGYGAAPVECDTVARRGLSFGCCAHGDVLGLVDIGGSGCYDGNVALYADSCSTINTYIAVNYNALRIETLVI